MNKCYWLFAFLFLIYFIFIAAPKKGFDLSDHGMYATGAFNFLHGIFNEWGLSDLVNALLLKFKFGYLNLEQFFYFLEFFSGFLFVMSLRLRTSFYWIAPVAVILMLASSPVHMLSYESAGPVLLMIATSLLFFAINYPSSKFWRGFCYALSAFFYTFSSASNLMLTPTLFINAIILFFVYPKIRNKIFIVSYLLTGLVHLYLILFKVLPVFELTANNFYHPGFFSWALFRVFKDFLMILTFFLIGFAITKCLMYFLTKKIKRYQPETLRSITIVTLTTLLWLAFRMCFHHYWFTDWKNSLLFYGFVYLGIIFAIYGCFNYLKKTQLLLALALLLHIEYFLGMTAPNGLSWSIRSLAHASQINLIVLMWLELFFLNDQNVLRKSLVALLLLVGAFLYPIKQQLNYAYAEFPSLNTEKITDIRPLRGLYMRPAQLNSVRKIIAIYHENHCSQKLFIVRQSAALFYFIFGRTGFSPLNYYDPKNDFKRLKGSLNKGGYCFIVDFLFDNIRTSNKKNLNHQLLKWLQVHSKKMILVPINGSCCGPYHVKLYMS